MDGLITFFASHYALRAETVLKRGGLPAKLVAGPRDLSPNCGVALRFELAQRAPAGGVRPLHGVSCARPGELDGQCSRRYTPDRRACVARVSRPHADRRPARRAAGGANERRVPLAASRASAQDLSLWGRGDEL